MPVQERCSQNWESRMIWQWRRYYKANAGVGGENVHPRNPSTWTNSPGVFQEFWSADLISWLSGRIRRRGSDVFYVRSFVSSRHKASFSLAQGFPLDDLCRLENINRNRLRVSGREGRRDDSPPPLLKFKGVMGQRPRVRLWVAVTIMFLPFSERLDFTQPFIIIRQGGSINLNLVKWGAYIIALKRVRATPHVPL